MVMQGLLTIPKLFDNITFARQKKKHLFSIAVFYTNIIIFDTFYHVFIYFSSLNESKKAVKILSQTGYDGHLRSYLSSGQIKEREDTLGVSYIFSDENLFYLTGYKVLQERGNKGFLQCAKVMQNGKIKLNYYIESYKSLKTVLPVLTPAIFLTIIYNLANVFEEIRNNGFIQCENIWVSPERIYVDPENLRVFLLYVPINIQASTDGISVFEKHLKKMILDILFENPHINDNDTQEIRKEIFSDDETTLNSLKKTLRLKGHPLSATINLASWESSLDTAYRAENSQPFSSAKLRTTGAQYHHTNNNATMPKQPLRLIQLLKHGLKTEPIVEIKPVEIDPRLLSFGDFNPKIALVSQNLPETLTFIINKPEYIIGKDATTADGVILANQFISSVHCKIISHKNLHFIEDMKSLNQTFVNGALIIPHKIFPLHVGNTVKLANIEFIVQPLSMMKIAGDTKTEPNPFVNGGK